MARIRGLHAHLIQEQMKGVLAKHNYCFFDGQKPHNVNIIGIRNSEGRPNKFDDAVLVIYRDKSLQWVVDSYQITSDPGHYWLSNPLNVKGTAILCPDQYRGVYKIDKHQGKYDALCQRNGNVTVWRDHDRDLNHDMNDATLDTGQFGINIHKAGSSSVQVNKWSAGCQVFKNGGDFNEFMQVIKVSSKRYSNSFTYTLLESKNFNSYKQRRRSKWM